MVVEKTSVCAFCRSEVRHLFRSPISPGSIIQAMVNLYSSIGPSKTTRTVRRLRPLIRLSSNNCTSAVHDKSPMKSSCMPRNTPTVRSAAQTERQQHRFWVRCRRINQKKCAICLQPRRALLQQMTKCERELLLSTNILENSARLI